MDKELFLKELLELSKKHGIFIIAGGYGDSAHLEDLSGNQTYSIYYEEKEDRYIAQDIKE